MRYSLVSRDWIADCVEIMHAGYAAVSMLDSICYCMYSKFDQNYSATSFSANTKFTMFANICELCITEHTIYLKKSLLFNPTQNAGN